jgi:hypothetical protein
MVLVLLVLVLVLMLVLPDEGGPGGALLAMLMRWAGG